MDYIKLLKDNGLLRVIDEPADIDLEIAHASYIEVKRENPQALLFTNPKNGTQICSRTNQYLRLKARFRAYFRTRSGRDCERDRAAFKTQKA